MTDISRLKVSLTKHNAHKIAALLKKYGPSQALKNLAEVHADEAQAHKNLSVQPGNRIPDAWSKAKKIGENAIDALVLIGITFSHHQLITAMINATGRSGFSGRIERNKQLSAKAYTNFVQIIDQLGYATRRDHNGVSFNLRSMFEIPGLGPLAGELLGHKLTAAKWDGEGTISDEAIAHNFHRVLGLTPKEFKDWITTDSQPEAAGTQLLPKDEEFFQTEEEDITPSAFEFKPGHEERPVEPITRSASARSQANQRHNDIQNRLYAHLTKKFGKDNVGTEIDTGSGTSIDLVTKQDLKVTFYEIKTGKSVRACIRQAIPQLLEYSYWPDRILADELVIVSHLPITETAKLYLKHLRERFNLPISYQQFNLSRNTLI